MHIKIQLKCYEVILYGEQSLQHNNKICITEINYYNIILFYILFIMYLYIYLYMHYIIYNKSYI